MTISFLFAKLWPQNTRGYILGVISLLVGAATVAAGANEAISGMTGVNYLREWTGMSESTYQGIYMGLNIASTVCTLFKGCRCFIAGTLVLTATGYKAIEDIQVGDLVLAYDEETGEQAYKPVKQLFRNKTLEWYHILVNGEEIVCTGGHPFYLADFNKFIPAKDLKVGNSLLLSNGTRVIIEEIQVEQLSTPETTYNFEVADFHTYYVSESKILTHNKCKQKIVAGEENGWNATVSVGGEQNHKIPHAHINWKRQKLASVDIKGNILVQTKMQKSVQRKMNNFIKNNIDKIAKGIIEWY